MSVYCVNKINHCAFRISFRRVHSPVLSLRKSSRIYLPMETSAMMINQIQTSSVISHELRFWKFCFIKKKSAFQQKHQKIDLSEKNICRFQNDKKKYQLLFKVLNKSLFTKINDFIESYFLIFLL